MIFERLPTTLTAEELLDKAFSRAARAGRSKSGMDAQESMLITASNILSDNLGNIVTAWPDLEDIDPFYYEIADILVGIDPIRQSLSELSWASEKAKELGREYQQRLRRTNPDTARKLRKQGFARMASVIDEIADDLSRISEARDALRQLPDIRPNEPTIVVAGYPNVGKSSFVNTVTNARNQVAEYPFTTKGVHVGHFEHDYIRYQIVDTPGLLDRPMADRNAIERQAISALRHIADCIIVLVDPSETCGYPITVQVALRDAIETEFPETPVMTVSNKADLSTVVDAEYYICVTDDALVGGRKSADTRRVVSLIDSVLNAAVEEIGYEPELPFKA